jgi:hypothetical protein
MYVEICLECRGKEAIQRHANQRDQYSCLRPHAGCYATLRLPTFQYRLVRHLDRRPGGKVSVRRSST